MICDGDVMVTSCGSHFPIQMDGRKAGTKNPRIPKVEGSQDHGTLSFPSRKEMESS